MFSSQKAGQSFLSSVTTAAKASAVPAKDKKRSSGTAPPPPFGGAASINRKILDSDDQEEEDQEECEPSGVFKSASAGLAMLQTTSGKGQSRRVLKLPVPPNKTTAATATVAAGKTANDVVASANAVAAAVAHVSASHTAAFHLLQQCAQAVAALARHQCEAAEAAIASLPAAHAQTGWAQGLTGRALAEAGSYKVFRLVDTFDMYLGGAFFFLKKSVF